MLRRIRTREARDDLVHEGVIYGDLLHKLDKALLEAPHLRILEDIGLQRDAVLLDELQGEEVHPARLAVFLITGIKDLRHLCGEGAEIAVQGVRRVERDARLGGIADDDLELGIEISRLVTRELTVRVHDVLDDADLRVLLHRHAVHFAAYAGIVDAAALTERLPVGIVDRGHDDDFLAVTVLILPELDKIVDKATNEIAFAKL